MTDDSLEQLIANVVALVPRESRGQPATQFQLETLQDRCNVRLPSDVIAFFSVCNGFSEPTHPDNGWVEIWNLGRWATTSLAGVPLLSPEARALIFADHCLSSWWYALDFTKISDGHVPVLFVDGANAPFEVFGDFRSFLSALLTDDPLLYGGPAG